MNDYPIRFKPEDAPSSPDPESACEQLMKLQRVNVGRAGEIRVALQNWGDDPVGTQRRVLGLVLELEDALIRAEGSAERAIKAKRSAGYFSHRYSTDLGVG